MSTTADEETTSWPNTKDLLEEYERWLTLPNIDKDDYSAFAKLAALYKFAILHQDSPGNELFFEALAEVDQTWKS